MRKTGRSKDKEQTGAAQRYLPLKEFAREVLWDTVVLSGIACAEKGLEAERTALCGARYAHLAKFADAGRPARRDQSPARAQR